MTLDSISSTPPGRSGDPDPLEAMGPALAAALAPIAPDAAAREALRGRLLQRAAVSAAQNRPMRAVRRDEGRWIDLAPGIHVKPLHRDEWARSFLVRCDAGAALPTGGAGWVDEWLLLDGGIVADGEHLGPQDYLITGHAQRRPSGGSEAGATFYLRRSLPGASALGGVAEGHITRAGEAGWMPLRRGVRIKPLAGADGVVSILASFEPGASVPGHEHPVGEECLMVSGDLFLGDVLLRDGEFQFAPQGSRHGELFSDVGCVLFFHGAVDPQLADPTVAG